jgi:cytochrome c-type biogenesis protein CcmF
MALIFLGVLGTPLNRTAEKEMGFGDKIEIGPYTLVGRSFTQNETPNYSSDIAILDVFRGGKQITTLYPESRFFTATQQPQHVPSVYSPLREDLYVVFEGLNQDTGRPIIKAHLNPLVSWLWIGVLVMLIGTALALFPNAAPVRAAAPAAVPVRLHAPAAPVGAGD